MAASLAYERLPFMAYYHMYCYAFTDRRNPIIERIEERESDMLTRLFAGKQYPHHDQQSERERENFQAIREARELKMVAAAVPLLASAPGVAREFKTRLDSIRHGEHDARWTPFAELRSRTDTT